MLHHYLSLLKNVQVLLFVHQQDNSIAEMGQRWLRQHFQPAEVGLLPKSPFTDWGVLLNYPQGSTARVFTELSPDVPSEVRDALVLASCYIVPLLVLGDEGWRRLAPYTFWVRRVSRLPDEAETLTNLHLAMNAAAQWFPLAREAFHSILDYLHGEAQSDIVDILVEKRRIQISQEAERILSGSTQQSDQHGYPFLFVADPLRLIVPWLRTMKRNLLLELPWDEFTSAGFGFAVGVVVAPENLRRFLRHERLERHPNSSHRPTHSPRVRHRP